MAMARSGSFILLMTVCVLSIGCGQKGDFPLAAVKGKVTCDGKPIPHAMVFFEPMKVGESAIVGKQGFATANENGEFVITTYDEGDGAVVGPHVVHVLPPNADNHPGYRCPCEFNSTSQPINVEVKQDGQNDFAFALPVKKSPQPLTLDQKEALQEARENQR